MQDAQSKFGTLLLQKAPLFIPNQSTKTEVLQIGRSILSVKSGVKKKLFCCRAAALSDSDSDSEIAQK